MKRSRASPSRSRGTGVKIISLTNGLSALARHAQKEKSGFERQAACTGFAGVRQSDCESGNLVVRTPSVGNLELPDHDGLLWLTKPLTPRIHRHSLTFSL